MLSSLSIADTNSLAAAAVPTTTTDSSENRPKKIQEEKFLQSRQERQNRKYSVNDDNNGNTRRSKIDCLYAFWKVVRQKLAEWEHRLVALEAAESLEAAVVAAAEGNKNSKKQDVRTELERLRLELDQWRKHCLSNKTVFTDEVELEQWEVPDYLPVSDLRVLHTEFTKCSSKWEAVHDKLFPKGKFVFRRYRQELARRNIRQEDLFIEQNQQYNQKNRNQTDSSNGTGISTTTQHQTSHPQHGHVNNDGLVQNLSYTHLVISKSGSVVSKAIFIPNEPTQVSSPDGGDSPVVDVPSEITSTSLLIRNLQHCVLVIHTQLHGLHLVDLSHVSIHVTQSMVSGTVHVTNCQHLTLVVKESQQLRLHDSTDLTCHVNATIGAILEGCTRIVLAIPPQSTPSRPTLTSTESENSSKNPENIDSVVKNEEDQTLLLDAKDFDWLRSGIPSPNFKVIEKGAPSPPSYPRAAQTELFTSNPTLEEELILSDDRLVAESMPSPSTKVSEVSEDIEKAVEHSTPKELVVTASTGIGIADDDDDDEL